MANVINGTSTGSGGLITTGDDSGILNIQTNETTAMSIDASQSVDFTNNIDAPNTFGFKNRIINGAMVIDQRNAGAAIANGFAVDRFEFQENSSSVFTVQKSTTAPAGFINSMLVTVTTAASATSAQVNRFFQRIEGSNISDLGFGTASASTVTISFWVRSSLTGTYCVGLVNNAANRAYVAEYTINSANTFEYKTITIAGDTSGTWETGTSSGIQVTFDLGSGSDYNATAGSWVAANDWRTTNQTNFANTNGATFYITGVQLEKGTQATAFDYRSYGTELALCQRYFYKKDGYVFQGFANGMAGSTTFVILQIFHPVPMRGEPTIAIGGSLRLSDGNNSITAGALSNSQSGRMSGYIVVDATGLTQYRPYFLGSNNDASAYLSGSAEL